MSTSTEDENDQNPNNVDKGGKDTEDKKELVSIENNRTGERERERKRKNKQGVGEIEKLEERVRMKRE